MGLNIILEILTFFLTILLSIFVLFQDYRNSINRYFFLLGATMSFWVASNMLADLSVYAGQALFFSRLAIIWPAFLPIFFNSLIAELYYTNDKVFIRRYRVLSKLSIIVAVIIIFLSQTQLNIISISIQPWGVDYVPGNLYYLMFLYLIIAFGFSFFYLFDVYRKYKNPKKSQALFMMIGAFLTIFLSVLINLILPLGGLSSLNIFGPPTVVFFIGFTAIAVLKHRLFNAKIIATELVVFALWIFVLLRTLVADNLQDQLINAIMLLLLIIFGILLIRSVIKEVSQREKIEKLATDLEKANVRLTELDRQKSEFVSFATHQLRAPLTAMKGYASMILEGDMGTLPKEANDGVSRIYESASTLTSIVDDYLNITRIELGSMKYVFDTVDLKALVEDTLAELKPNIEKSGLAFSFTASDGGIDWRITADRDKLKQVIGNLIDNSMKYTPSGSVAVSLSFDRPRHKFVLTLKDTGIGIAPEILPHLFQKWSRAGNANKTNIKGTGLGLYVAKEMIEAHHGVIRAESAGEGKGSTFIVELEPFGKV